MLESALASTPLGIGYADRDLRFVRVNDALARFTGHTADAHVGQRVRDLLPHPAGALAEPLLQRVFDTGEPALGLEVQLPTPGHLDSLRHFIVSLYPVRDPRGETCWVGASITESQCSAAPSRSASGCWPRFARARHVSGPCPNRA